MALKPPLPSDNLELTIRFSASLPDLQLSISLAEQPHANTSTLKQLIRTQLPPTLSSRRIRLIYSGKALNDDALLTTSLKRPLSVPPSRTSTPRPSNPHHGGNADTPPSASLKGKTPLRPSTPTPLTRIYIHCSIGDLILTPPELAAEARLAQPPQDGNSSQATQQQPLQAPAQDTTTTQPPPPRGFDRLLSAGFTASEITSLRMQFLSIQAHTHTPDDMPSPSTLRAMEDAWLDNSSGTVPSGTATDADGMAPSAMMGSSDEDSEGNALDDMLWGMAMGFFWPVGCLWWAVREEGLWSGRRKTAVFVGALMNLGVGFVRFTG